MAYTKLERNVAGVGLTQVPAPNSIEITPILLDVDVASTSNLGIVQIGSGINITPQGVISVSGSGGGTIGIWTPVITASVAGIIALNIRNANYSKIGQQVFCTFDIEITSISSGSSAATLKLAGLPYPSITDTGYVGSVLFSYFKGMNTNVDYIGGTVISNSSQADLWFESEQKKDLSKITQGDIKAGTRLVGTVQYLSAN